LREHAFAAPMATDAAQPLDIPLFGDAVPVSDNEETLQRQA
jgi:hypothetical protein